MKNKQKIKPELSRTKEIIKIPAKMYDLDKTRKYKNGKLFNKTHIINKPLYEPVGPQNRQYSKHQR